MQKTTMYSLIVKGGQHLVYQNIDEYKKKVILSHHRIQSKTLHHDNTSSVWQLLMLCIRFGKFIDMGGYKTYNA